MRTLALTGLCLLTGCWDFDALTGGPGKQDGGGDLATPNGCVPQLGSEAEDCSDGIDNDLDCKKDCEDTDCAGNFACIVTGATLKGYGDMTRDLVTACVQPRQTLDLKQDLMLSNSCTGCLCGPTPVAQCSTTVYRYATAASCPAGTETQKVTLTSTAGSPGCTLIDTMATTDAFKVDATKTTCPTAAGTGVPGANTWGKSYRMCMVNSAGSTCKALDCLKPLGNCLVFAVNDPATFTCPAGYASTPKNPWYTSAIDKRSCQCSCDPTAASCGLAGRAELTEATQCPPAGTAKKGAIPADGTCIANSALGLGGMTLAKTTTLSATPACMPNSAVSTTNVDKAVMDGQIKYSDAYTLCCQMALP